MKTAIGDDFPNLNRIICRSTESETSSAQFQTSPNNMASRNQNQFEKEIRSHFEKRQQSLNILATTTSPSGQVIDWIPIESQGEIASPPPPPTVQNGGNVPVAVAELDMDGAEKGPEGTVPILRKNLDAIEFKEPLSKYLNKIRGAHPSKDKQSTQEKEDPQPQAAATHRYGSSQQGKQALLPNSFSSQLLPFPIPPLPNSSPFQRV